ncbi:hypothetical protein ACEK07_42295 [Alcanivoracaceae bacterium MT1]
MLLQRKIHPCTMNPTPDKQNNQGGKAQIRTRKEEQKVDEPNERNAVTPCAYGARQKTTQTITTTESAHRASQPRL